MLAKTKRQKASQATRAASLAIVARQPKITLKTRRTTVLFNNDIVETVDLVASPPPLPPLKPLKPPFTYILVWRILVRTANGLKELRRKTNTVELGLFNYAEFSTEAI